MPANAAPDPVLLGLDDIRVTVPDARDGTRTILTVPGLDLAPGDSMGIAGPSGAGKSTLLKVIAGLIIPAMGTVRWNGVSLPQGRARDQWRRRSVGLVFQDFALLPELDALDNVLLPADFDHWRRPAALVRRAGHLLTRLGISDHHGRAGSLSRGEQQRVAVARALLSAPALLLADEPTASLDADNGQFIASLLLDAVRETGAALVVVSHDQRVLDRCGRVVRLDRGRLVESGS